MTSDAPTAALLIIGNEILSGRTHDKNLPWLAEKLGEIGIPLVEARVVPDVEETIISTVRTMAAQATYLFTTGGIGPTHDDITTACIAKAFGVPLHTHPDALAALERHYKAEDLNDARRKMAIVPQGARLIANPVSAAPGFVLENVYVMAGVPRIMQAMLDEVLPTLKGGVPISSRTVSTFIPEGTMAAGLTAIQTQFPVLSLGSYPFFQQGRAGVSVVMRGTDETALDACEKAVQELISTFAAG